MASMLALVAACSWAAAVWLLVPGTRGALGRLVMEREGSVWFEPPPGALSRRVRAVMSVAVGVIVVVLVGVGPLVGALLGCGAGLAAFVGLRFVSTEDRAAHREELMLDLPEILDLLASALASGAPLRRAVRMVADLAETPVTEELRQVVARIDVGMPDADAWAALADDPVLGETARDLARQVESGTGVEELLRVRAADARTEAVALRQRRARTAGVRSALPLAACFLPAFVLVGIVPAVAGAVVALWPGL